MCQNIGETSNSLDLTIAGSGAAGGILLCPRRPRSLSQVAPSSVGRWHNAFLLHWQNKAGLLYFEPENTFLKIASNKNKVSQISGAWVMILHWYKTYWNLKKGTKNVLITGSDLYSGLSFDYLSAKNTRYRYRNAYLHVMSFTLHGYCSSWK